MTKETLNENQKASIDAFMQQVNNIMADPDFFVESTNLFGSHQITLKKKNDLLTQSFIHLDTSKNKASLKTIQYGYYPVNDSDSLRFQGKELHAACYHLEPKAFRSLVSIFHSVHLDATSRALAEFDLYSRVINHSQEKECFIRP